MRFLACSSAIKKNLHLKFPETLHLKSDKNPNDLCTFAFIQSAADRIGEQRRKNHQVVAEVEIAMDILCYMHIYN